MSETTRRVRYLIGVEVDGQAEANAKQMADLLSELQHRRTKEEEEEGRKREEDEKARIKRITDEIEKQAKAYKDSHKEMHDGLLQSAEGAVTLARGFAELGIVHKDNAEQMLKALIQVQAAVDLAKGGIEVYRGIATAVDAYRASVIAAAAAEEALAAARARGVGAGAASTSGQYMGGAASGMAGGGVGSVLGPALGGLSAAIFSLPGAIALAITGTLGAGAMAFNVGGSRDAAANAIPQDWVDPDSTFGWAAGGVDSVSGYTNMMFGGIPVGGLGMFGGLAGDQAGASGAEAETQRRQAARQAQLAMFDRNNATAQGQFDFNQQLQNMQFARMSAAGVDPQAQLAQAMTALNQARQGSATAAGMAPGMMRDAEMGRAAQAEVAALDRVIALRKEGLSISQQESRERLAGVTKETSELMKQLEIAKKQQQAADDRLKSAKERFGGMDEATQRRLIAAKQKADAQGATSLTREERALLSSVGTTGASEIASQGNIAAADALGFDQFFGGTERSESSAAAATQASLEAKIKVKQDLKVQIEGDIQKQAEAVGDAIAATLEEREQKIIEILTRRFNQEQAQRNRQPGPGTTPVGS